MTTEGLAATGTTREVVHLPHVGDALVLSRPALPSERGTHIGDVCEWLVGMATTNRTGGGAGDQPVPAPDGATSTSRERPPAHLRGAPFDPATIGYRTLQEALTAAATTAAERGTTFVRSDGTESRLRYDELLRTAERLLGGLRALGLEPGDPVLFQFGDNRNFIIAFWACQLGGFLPTPVGLAPTYQEWNTVTRKLRSAWELLAEPVILCDAVARDAVSELASLWSDVKPTIAVVDDLAGDGGDVDWYRADPDDPALLLLTSGSTGIPKCVRHTHRTLLARAFSAITHSGLNSDDVSLNWMPLDHVCGIVMFHLRDVVLRCAQVIAPVDQFLARPLACLDWIERYRATVTWSPNFAFALVNDHAAEIRNGRWDLSSMRRIENGGEAVVSRTTATFLSLLRPHGMAPDVMYPTWGMSETGSGVTFSRFDGADPGAASVTVDKRSMSGDLRPADPTDPDAMTFVTVGRPIPGFEIRVVDDDGVLPEDRIGRLQVRGVTMMTEYFRNAAANRKSFTDGGWFETGDLAFVHDGELIIAGRESDRIIINGANFLSYEIESVVEQVAGVVAAHSAAASTPDDKLLVFFVPEDHDATAVGRTIGGITAGLARQLGVAAHRIVPVTRDEFPRTASGKIQRSALVNAYLEGRFTAGLRALDVELESEEVVPAWFFTPTWEPVPLPDADRNRPEDGVTLLIAGTGAFGDRLAERLGRAVRVRPGPAFAGDVGSGVTIDPANPLHYLRLADLLRRAGVRLTRVVDGLGTDRPRWRPGDPVIAPALSFVWLVQALGRNDLSDVRLLTVTRAGYRVGSDSAADPPGAGLHGLVRTAAAERVLNSVRHLDLDPHEDIDRWVEQALDELTAEDDDTVVAYRRGTRFVPRIRPVPVDPSATLTRGGRYVITGGLGGIGFELARLLLAGYQARLLLIGRGEPRGRAAACLDELSALGDVAYTALDVTDPHAVQEAVEAAECTWGAPFDAAFHLAAASPASFWDNLEAHALRVESADQFRTMADAKVAGACALFDLLDQRPAAQVVVFSSVNGFFGGSSFGAYALASSLADGVVAAAATRYPGRVRSLGWSLWASTGMAVTASVSASQRMGFLALSRPKALASLVLALGLPQRHLLIGIDRANPEVLRHVAARDLTAAEVAVIYPEADGADESSVRAAVAALTGGTPTARLYLRPVPELTGEVLGRDDDSLWDQTRLGDCDDGDAVDAPLDEKERLVAAFWSEVLGRQTERASVNFFETGGTSVLAMRLIAKVNQATGATLAVRDLYDNPTLRAFAAVVGTGVAGGDGISRSPAPDPGSAR